MVERIQIATFNVESLDEPPVGRIPIAQRIDIMRPQLERLRADVLCLQEVNGQKMQGKSQPRTLHALRTLISGTVYEDYHLIRTQSSKGGALDRHNLVILSRFPIVKGQEVRHALVPAPSYQPVTQIPPAIEPQSVGWDRPFLYAELDIGAGKSLHVIDVHLRARRAAFIPG